MPILKQDAERCLHLLWEYRSLTKDAEKRQAYDGAISGLHAYLSDILPATLPCVRARAKDGVVEIFRKQDARVNEYRLDLSDGEKLGLVLDSVDVNGWSQSGTAVSPIVISLLRPNSAAAKDGRLARGDQVISINGHSMSQVSLQRARWLLDSADRSRVVILSVISSGLVDGLKHSISRSDITSLTPRTSHQVRHRSRSHESLRVKRLLSSKSQKSQEIKRSHTEIVKKQDTSERASSSHSSMHMRPGFTPSIGSHHGSDYSLVSSIVDTAAHLARSSTRSSKDGGIHSKRKVRKMHIMKGASGLGLRIIGGKGSKYGDMGIFISQLEEGGAASNDKRLHPGDELLMVDGKTLVGLTHDEAVGVLKGTQKLVQLVIATEYNIEEESLESSQHSIPEKSANIFGATSWDRQKYNPQENTDSGLSIAPETFQSPQRNAFHQENITALEMKNINSEGYLATDEKPFEQMETNLDNGSVASGAEKMISITRSEEDQSLGFSIGESGPAAKSKDETQLCERDKILKVDDISLDRKTQQEALEILTKEIVLHKKVGQLLGLKLTSHSMGDTKIVSIEKIAPGSPAHEAINLCVGDQFLSVNGINVIGMSVEQVRGLLSNMPGLHITLQMVAKDSEQDTDAKVQLKNTVKSDGGQEMNLTLTPSCHSSEDRHLESDSDDGIGSGKVLHHIVSQSSKSESSIIEISGNFESAPLNQTSSDDSIIITHEPPLDSTSSVHSSSPQSSHTLSLPPDSSLVPTLPLPPLDGDGDGNDDDPVKPPTGFISLKFQMKKRGRGGLGITVKACEGVTAGLFMIRRIATTGVAARDGRLCVGDRLVFVNGEHLLDLTHAIVLQALNEAPKDVELIVWRDTHPNLTSSLYSLGSHSNLSGSHSSIEYTADSSPHLNKRRGFPSPVYRGSPVQGHPLTNRFSFASTHTPPQKESPLQMKRWSDGDIIFTKIETVGLTDSIPSDDELSDPIPPDLPGTPPPELSEISSPILPGTTPLEILEGPPQGLSIIPPQLPPLENTGSVPTVLATIELLSSSDFETPPSPPADKRPRSLQVPQGERLENSPFEIELKKGLFSLGVSFMVNMMGMLALKSLSNRSVIYQDGNIRVGDILLQINDESVIGWSPQKVEVYLKALPRGLFRLTVMAPPKDVTGVGVEDPPSPPPQVIENDEEGIIQVTLDNLTGSPLGFEIEGGTGSSHMYIYIKSLTKNSPAYDCGQFTAGDQLVMVGGVCLIGMTHKEASDILNNDASPTLEVIVQRKSSPKQSQTSSQENLGQIPMSHSRQTPISSQEELHSGQTPMSPYEELHSGQTPMSPNEEFHSKQTPMSSQENLHSGQTPMLPPTVVLLDGEVDNNNTVSDLNPANNIPEESVTVELIRTEGEKLGIGIVGGIDNPNLTQVHVKQVRLDGVAGVSGCVKRGDRIVSVNGKSLNDLTNKQALSVLKEAGNHVTLVLTRKVGRRYSRATTPKTSTQHSRQQSGETSRVESRRMSPQQHSPHNSRRRGRYSSDEGSRDNSQGASPQITKKHRRRESVTAQGEVLTFRNSRSTLPRQLKGAKIGVHLVELHKGPTSLGIQLQGGVTDSSIPITVKEVLKGGAAHKNGQIHGGDEILEVNGVSFENLNYQEAVQVMKGFPQGKVSIILRDHKAIN